MCIRDRGNEDEATIPDDIPFSVIDINIAEDDEDEEVEKRAEGGVIEAANGFAGTTTTSSIQELRYYKKVLSSEVISGHAQNREAYYSDDNTTDLDIDTSFENVLYRIFPDSKYNTTSSFISSRHPNQKVTASDRGFILSASYANSDSNRLSGEVDTQFVTIPSVGALNLNSRKVRIESSSLLGNLQFDKSNERSQYDQAPIDSNLLGTYFSTTDTVNFDIYASEGYFSTDDLIGDTDVRNICLLYTSPSPRDLSTSRMPSSA